MKKVVAVIVLVVMSVTIFLGYAKKNKILFFEEQTRNAEDEAQKQADEVWAEKGTMSDEDFQNQNAEKISIVNMGEQGEVYDHIGITIHSAYQTENKDVFVPEEMREFCWSVTEDLTYVVMDFEVKNLDVVEQMFQMSNFCTINDEYGLEAWDIVYSGLDTAENQEDKDRYWRVFQPGEELRMTVAIFVAKEHITENGELDLIINPRAGSDLVGAAKFHLKLETK